MGINEPILDGSFFQDAKKIMDIRNGLYDISLNGYLGSSEQDKTTYSSLALRDFAASGEAHARISKMLGSLFIKSSNFKNEDEERLFLKDLSLTKTDEEAFAIIDSHIYGLADSEKGALQSTLAGMYHTSKDVHDRFQRIAAKQNPVVDYLVKNITDHQNDFEETAFSLAQWRDGAEVGGQPYKKQEFIMDLHEASRSREINKRLHNFLRESEFVPNTEVLSSDALRDLLENRVEPILNSLENSRKDELLDLHNQVSHISRAITLEAFYQTSKESFSVSQCMPSSSATKEERDACSLNTKKMLAFAFSKLKANDSAIAVFLSKNRDIESQIKESVLSKLIETPSSQINNAYDVIDSSKAEMSAKFSPGSRDEEQLSKMMEDTIYNTIFTKIADKGLLQKANINTGADGPIDVVANVFQQNYNPLRLNSGDRRAFEVANDLFKVEALFKKATAGRLTKEESKAALRAIGSSVVKEPDKDSLASALKSFYDKKEANFNPKDFGISEDKLQAKMDINSSMIDRQAREIHEKFYGSGIMNKTLSLIGLKKEAGETFMRCVNSGRNATIKSHSTGHDIKSCIDNLIAKYEKDAEMATQGIGNQLVAMSGISGLMLLFSIFEKSKASKLKRMSAEYENIRNEAIEYASSAKDTKEMVLYESIIRLKDEDIVEEVVASENVDLYVKDSVWASHVYESKLNEYLKNNKSFADMGIVNGRATKTEENLELGILEGQDKKTTIAYDAIMNVLDSAGVSDEYAEYMDFAKEEEIKNFQVLKANSAIRYEEISKDSASLGKRSRARSRLFEVSIKGIKSGIDPLLYTGRDGATAVLESVKEIMKSVTADIVALEAEYASYKEKAEAITAMGENMDPSDRREMLLARERISIIEHDLPELKKELAIMAGEVEAVGGVEEIVGKSKSFQGAFDMFKKGAKGRESFSGRFGGYISSPFFLGSDLERMDGFSAHLSKKYPGKFKNKQIGNAIQAMKTITRTLTMYQVSEREKRSVRDSFNQLYIRNKKELIRGSSVKFHSLKQEDGSHQLIMVNRASIEDIKKFKPKNGEDVALYDYLDRELKTADEIKEDINKCSTDEEKEAIRRYHEYTKEKIAEFSDLCGFSSITEKRYAEEAKSKQTSNNDAILDKEPTQSGMFSQVQKLKSVF